MFVVLFVMRRRVMRSGAITGKWICRGYRLSGFRYGLNHAKQSRAHGFGWFRSSEGFACSPGGELGCKVRRFVLRWSSKRFTGSSGREVLSKVRGFLMRWSSKGFAGAAGRELLSKVGRFVLRGSPERFACSAGWEGLCEVRIFGSSSRLGWWRCS